MNVVRYAADAVGFAIHVSSDGGKVGVKSRAYFGIEEWLAILRAKDEMCNEKTVRLRHTMGRAFSPDSVGWSVSWGVAPGWDGIAPLALSRSSLRQAQGQERWERAIQQRS